MKPAVVTFRKLLVVSIDPDLHRSAQRDVTSQSEIAQRALRRILRQSGILADASLLRFLPGWHHVATVAAIVFVAAVVGGWR